MTQIGAALGYVGTQTLTRQQILDARDNDPLGAVVVELHTPRPLTAA